MLIAQLESLSNECEALLKTEAGQAAVRSASIGYVQPRVTAFEYDAQRGLQLKRSYERVAKLTPYPETWELFELLERSKNTFSECIAGLRRRKDKLAENDAKSLLGAFVKELVINHYRETGRFSCTQLIADFLDLVNENALDWAIELGLVGITLEEESIKLVNDFTLRRPIPEDFEVCRLECESLLSPLAQIPTAILSGRTRTSVLQEVMSEANQIITALRLLGLGSVTEVTNGSRPLGPITRHRFGVGGIGRFEPPAIRFKYILTVRGTDDVNLFFGRILKPLQEALQPFSGQHGDKPLNIAIQLYEKGLFQTASDEEAIAMSISCLESLLLKGSERTELTHKLAQRCAKMIHGVSGVSSSPIQVFQNVVRAYEVRSTYIHGAFCAKEEQQALRELKRLITDYARIALVTFLQLTEEAPKERLIARVDNALLDENASGKLKATLEAVILPKDATRMILS